MHHKRAIQYLSLLDLERTYIDSSYTTIIKLPYLKINEK